MKNLTGGEFRFWPAEEPKPDNPLYMKPQWSQWQNHYHNLGNIFCAHFVDVNALHQNIPFAIDPRNARPGNYFLAITELPEFMSCIKTAVEKLGHACQSAFVHYRDLKNHSGTKGVFDKDRRFAHECEWRALFTPGSPGPLIIRLGSIESISQLCCADLDEMKIFFQNDNTIALKNCSLV